MSARQVATPRVLRLRIAEKYSKYTANRSARQRILYKKIARTHSVVIIRAQCASVYFSRFYVFQHDRNCNTHAFKSISPMWLMRLAASRGSRLAHLGQERS